MGHPAALGGGEALNVIDLLAQIRHADAAISQLERQVGRTKDNRYEALREIARLLGIDPTLKVSVNYYEPWKDDGGEVLTYCREAGKWLPECEVIFGRRDGVAVCAIDSRLVGLYPPNPKRAMVIRPLSAEVK